MVRLPVGRPRRSLRRWAAVAVLALTTTACTYSRVEPGIFPEPGPPAPSTPEQSLEPIANNPDLPVLADAVWVSGEGYQINLRFAIHAIRRIQGATILDWSVTPLRTGALEDGEAVPMAVDLGLTGGSTGAQNVFLIDTTNSTVYRPLISERGDVLDHCLCTPLWAAQLDLRIGATRLLQTAFPELPQSIGYVDVDLANSLPFWHVPVFQPGRIGVVAKPTDLARPPDDPPLPAERRLVFRHTEFGQERLQSITLDRVERSPGLTSVSWTLSSLSDQPEFWYVPHRPPIGAAPPASIHLYDFNATDGLALRAPGRQHPLRPIWISRSQNPGYDDCLCTNLGLWASSLTRRGGLAQIVTNFPALPEDVSSVDIILPGAGQLPGIPVAAAADASAGVRYTIAYRARQWSYDPDDPLRGWGPDDWPTPVPNVSQLPSYRRVVDKLLNPQAPG